MVSNQLNVTAVSPTPFADLNGLLADFTAEHVRILGDNLIGLYLQGSAAIGDMDIFSDVDFVAVLKKDLTAETLAQMQALTLEFFERREENHWAEHFEGSYFPIDVLRRTDRPDEKVWYNDNGSHFLEPSTHCNSLVVRWCLVEHAVVLIGPAFDTLIDPVPTDRLKAEIADVIVDWGAEIVADPSKFSSLFYQTFISISYARMLHSLATGRVHSKPAGVKWAIENLDAEWHAHLQKALDVRNDSGINARKASDPAEMQKTVAFVTHAMNQISQV